MPDQTKRRSPPWPERVGSVVCTGPMDAAAFATTYRSQLPPVRARCRRLLGDAVLAEDVAQEAFTRLWRAGEPLKDATPAAIAAWLHQTSTRLAIDALRARKRLVEHAHQAPALAAAADAIVSARRSIEVLHRAVPTAELEAAMLVRVDGFAHAEVASEMGVSERTVRRLLDRFDRRAGALRGMLAVVLAIAALVAGRSCAASPAESRGRTAADGRAP